MDENVILDISDLIGDYEELVVDATELLSLSESGTNEFDETGSLSKETLRNIKEKTLKLITGVVARVYKDSTGAIVLPEVVTGMHAIEFLQAAKEYHEDDADADKLIDATCAFIKNLTSKYPIIGPVVGSLFSKAARQIFNGARADGELLNVCEDLIRQFLDKIYQGDYYQEYQACLLEQKTLPGVSQNEITQLGNGVILIPNFQGVRSISGTSNGDTIKNESNAFKDFNNVRIYGLGGNDSISTYLSSNVTIEAGSGDDTIYSDWLASGIIINGGTGNDLITNSGGSSTIDGGDDNDYIEVSLAGNVNVNGGNGDDTIINSYGANTLIGGEGNDLIDNVVGNGSYIFGSDGNDTINNGYKCSNVFISGGEGDDFIQNSHEDNFNIYISGDKGNDIIHNSSNTVSIYGGEGNDSLINNGNNSKIYGGMDNDTIINYAATVTVDGNTGNDNLTNNSTIVKLYGGDGDDIIANNAATVTIDGGNGNDTINSNAFNVTINGDSGNDSIYSNGYNNRIDAGEGNDKVENNGIDASIYSGSGDDTVLIYGFAPSVEGSVIPGKNALIYANDGNDSIYNCGRYATIHGGADNDTVLNTSWGFNSSIEGNDGNDFLGNNASNVTINGGTGNDFLLSDGYKGNNAFNVVINGGRDNDTIRLGIGAINHLICYRSGDGFDSIIGFNETSTLSIAGDSYSAQTSGDDVIVTVGDGSITLLDAATLQAININEEIISNFEWTLEGTTATYGTLNETVIILNGVKSTEGISIDGKTVTLTQDALGSSDVTISDGYTLALSNVSAPKTTAAHFDGLTYKSESNTEGYTLADNKITYTSAKSATDLFSLSGLKNSAGISINGTKVIITDEALSNRTSETISISGGDYKLALSADSTVKTSQEAVKSAATFTKSGDNHVYKSTAYGDRYDVTESAITYHAPIVAKEFSISGLNSSAELDTNVFVTGGKVKITSGALDTNHEKISLDTTDYALELGDDVATVKTINFAHNGNKVTLGGTTAGYKSDGKGGFEWQEQIGGEILTITGLKSDATLTADMFNVSNGKITFKPTNALLPDKPSTITISDGVIDTSELATTKAVDTHWNGNTYISAKTASSWTTGASTVKFTAATGGVEQFTISGLKSDADVTKLIPDANGNIQLTNEFLPDATAASLKLENVVAGGSYKFVLPNGTKLSTKGETIAAKFTGKSGTYNYTSAYDEEYYSGNDTAITYHKSTTPKTFTISGLKTGLTLGKEVTVSGDTVTLTTEAVDKSNIALTSDTYKQLTLPTALTKKISHAAAFTNSTATFTYKGAYTDAYFSGGGTSYTYNKSTESNATTFTVTNLKSASDKNMLLKAFNASKKTLTLTRDYLNGAYVKISKGYKLAVDKNSAPSQTKSAGFVGTTYKTATMSDGYSASGNKITYIKSSGGNKVFTLTNTTITDAIKVDTSKKIVTLNGANLNKKVVTVDGGYTLALADDVAKSATKTDGTFTKISKGTATFKTNSYSDFYTLKNNKISYTASKSGKEISIGGLKSTAKLSAVKKSITVTEKSNDSCTIIFTDANVLNGKAPTITAPKALAYTVAVTDNLSTASTTTAWTVGGTNAALKSTTGATYAVKKNAVVYAAKKVETQVELSGLAKGVKASSISLPDEKILTLNASVLGTTTSLKSNGGNYSIKLAGNMKGKIFVGTSGADKISIAGTNAKVNAGGGNDSLVGGKGNDTLSGGEGNDTLTGGAGNDVFVYTSGKDVITDFATGDKISLGADISKSTVKKSDAVFTIGTGSLIVKDGKGKKISFVDENGTSRTILGGAQIFTDSSSAKVTLSSGVEVGDASARSEAIKLTGNKLANTIFGGLGNDSLYGGKGDDSILGGNGDDSLWGGSGKDTFLYSNGDGKDVIFGFNDDDLLKITGKFSATYSKSKDEVYFKVGSTAKAITLRDFDATTFNVNGKTYTISGTKLK